MESTVTEEVVTDSMAKSDGPKVMRNILDQIIASQSLDRLKRAIKIITDLLKDKQYFFDLKEFYHLFCDITDLLIDEPFDSSVVGHLNTFYMKTIDVCYEWKCLSDYLENDFQFLNTIHLVLNKIIIKLKDNSIENQFTDHCIPLLLNSMIIIVSTVYGLKEVAVISKPITTEIVIQRHRKGLLNSKEWERLMSCLLFVCDVWKKIHEIDGTDEQLSQFVISSVNGIFSKDPFVKHISAKAFRYLSHEKNLSMDQLFIEYQSEIGSHILQLLENNSNFNNFGNILSKTMSLFGIYSLPRELLRHIIPSFALKCDSNAKQFIEEISKMNEKPIKYIPKVYFNDIIHYLFYSKTSETNTEKITKLYNFGEFTDFNITYKARVRTIELVSSLLMHWSEDHNSTLEALAFAHFCRSHNNIGLDLNRYLNDESLLRSDLKEYFLPFVHRFDSLMQDYSVSSRAKMRSTNSFVILIDFMDNQCINIFRVKIFSTIKLILSEKFYANKPLLKLSIEVIMKFIKAVDHSYLSSQLLTICALLLPSMHFWPNETSNVFKELIVKNESNFVFQKAFKNLYFIPECKELTEVTEVIKPHITSEDPEKQIQRVVDNINHENSKVQEFSLRELLKLLSRHQSLIHKKCNNIKEFSFDDFVNKIVTQLMLCLKSNNGDVLQLVAECLGVLGAIDPLRIDLDKPIISKEEKSPLFLNSNDKEFKINLIKILYRSMTSATKTEDQYCASYALQELIKQFSTDDGFNTDVLPQEMKGYCDLLKNTSYKNTEDMDYCELNSEPIFGSDPDLTYQEWLNKWLESLFQSLIFIDDNDNEDETNGLLSQSTFGSASSQRSDMFESELAKALTNYSIKSQVLKVCSVAIIRNESVARFLLPYIVITALKNATLSEKKIIVNEVKTIITKLTTDESVFVGQSGHLSSQTVFLIYDSLKIWHKNRILLHKKVCTTARQLKTAVLMDKEFKGVKYFLDNISTQELAVLAFKCNAFSRSLRYIEEYVKSDVNTFQEHIPFLQKIFVCLDEPDSVDGCNCKHTGDPNINQRILTHEAMGQIQEALICASKAIELNPNRFECIEKYLQISLNSFDQSDMVYTYGTGLMVRHPEWIPKVAPYVVEAVWKLGDWHQLNGLLGQYDNCLTTFGSGIGSLFCILKNRRDSSELERKVSALRRGLVAPLSAAAMEISGYVRGHKFIVNLHILNDIQLVYNNLMAELDDEVCSIESLKIKFSSIVDIWDKRNDLIRKTIECQEPILNSQRAMLSILSKRPDFVDLSPDIKKQLFKSWLMSTKTSRKSGNIQRSYNCLLEVNKMRDSLVMSNGSEGPLFSVSALSDIENCEAIIETAKVFWDKNNKIDAIQYLKNQIQQNYSFSLNQCIDKALSNLKKFSTEELMSIRKTMSFGSSSANTPSNSISNQSTSTCSSSMGDSSHEAFAKLQLLYTKYCDKNGILNPNELAILYKSVTIAAPKSEESHYNLGMYCNKLFINFEESKKDNKSYSMGKPEEILDMKGRTVNSLIESLKYGVKHAHNSLPLLLNIWFDLGTDYIRETTKSKNSLSPKCEEIRQIVEKINNSLNSLLANVPIFVFFISFAQLTARVLHPMPSITAILKRILIRLIIEFPQQSMWLLMRSYNSQNSNRKKCFNDIISKAIVQERHLQKFVTDIVDFGKQLTEMCQKSDGSQRNKGQRVRQLSFRNDFPKLAKMFDPNCDFSQILLPFRSLVNVTLPKSIHEQNYNPFPTNNIFIERFDDCIELLHSLQRPKKITINGSDGKTYTILCKPGDDLRKDHSFIEFSNLLNRVFKTDSEARRRQLRVKTYLVVSLTDSCGLIEWVPGLIPFRTIVENQYRIVKDYDAIKDSVIKSYPIHTLPKTERVRRFQNDILPQFKPSVFSNWFASTYTDPLSWFAARLAYTRSTAVFSVIGYLLGLGDRHGENIMIEEMSGQTVHVDLNCMFNKGEDFQVPERVPFRLTHNMVNAMGITEFEGTFRKACEHALRVARDNKEALMNFVNPFLFDHLVEWTRNNNEIRSTCSEIPIPQAEKILYNIESRLKGIPSRNDSNLPKGIPLSVEGQVDYIIKEATDVQNLGVMYVGWTAYI